MYGINGVIQFLIILLLLQGTLPLRLSDSLLSRIHSNHDSAHTVVKRNTAWIRTCSTCGISTKVYGGETEKKKDNSVAKKDNSVAKKDNSGTKTDNSVTKKDNSVTKKDNSGTKTDNSATKKDNSGAKKDRGKKNAFPHGLYKKLNKKGSDIVV